MSPQISVPFRHSLFLTRGKSPGSAIRNLDSLHFVTILLSRVGFQNCSSQHHTVSEEKEREESFVGNFSFGASGMGQEYIISAYMRRISNVTWSKLSIMQAGKCVLTENQGKGEHEFDD